MGLGKRDSFYSLCCAVGSAALALAAGFSFQRGDKMYLTVQPYVTAPFHFLIYLYPFKAAPPSGPSYVGRSAFEFTESESMLLLLYFSAAGAIAATLFAWRSLRRREPSQQWAFPLLLSALVAVYLGQLLYWIAPRWGF